MWTYSYLAVLVAVFLLTDFLRYKPVIAYLEKTLGVPVEFRNATDYAGVIEALNADKLQVAGLGPAAYAPARLSGGGLSAASSVSVVSVRGASPPSHECKGTTPAAPSTPPG